MNALAFSDGSSFCDGAGFWLPAAPAIIGRPLVLVFYDPAARPRPQFVDGWSANRLDRCLLLGDRPRTKVQVNPRYVSRAVECNWLGYAGFLLERRNGEPFAWVPRFSWLEATKP